MFWINGWRETKSKHTGDKQFHKWIERDMEAVRNAIKYEYSNGLAEGALIN